MILLLSWCAQLHAQSDVDPEPTKNISDKTALWLGYYTKFRVSKKGYYYGEYHIRRKNFAADMSKLYLRFGYAHMFTKKFELTVGIATPLSWSPYQGDPDYDDVTMEFRFWEQLLFVDKVYHSKIYHQLRFEQRWKRDYEKNSPHELTFRFRYRFTTYIPLVRKKLAPGTTFISLYDEIFIQAGESITYNHFEDNRLFLGLGYIINNAVQMQAGYMWSFKHDGSPYDYVNTHILRISLYHSLDFYRNR